MASFWRSTRNTAVSAALHDCALEGAAVLIGEEATHVFLMCACAAFFLATPCFLGAAFFLAALVVVRSDQTCTRDQTRSALHNKLDRSDLLLVSICATSLIDQIKLARYSARQAWSIRSSLHNITCKRLHSSDTSSIHQHYACGVLADFCGQIRWFFVI